MIQPEIIATIQPRLPGTILSARWSQRLLHFCMHSESSGYYCLSFEATVGQAHMRPSVSISRGHTQDTNNVGKNNVFTQYSYASGELWEIGKDVHELETNTLSSLYMTELGVVAYFDELPNLMIFVCPSDSSVRGLDAPYVTICRV